jgi:hypothetical protein
MEKYNQQTEEDFFSTVDLGQCEAILKAKHNVPPDESLIIYKTDIKSNDSSTTYVQYKIYHPDTLDLLDYLTDCSKEQISISVPVYLNEATKALYNNANNNGYDISNSNDSFYNDICAIYTTENGTDMSLNDRKNVIEESGGNLNYCQVGCTLESFNVTNQKAKCNCSVAEIKNVTNINDIEFSHVLLLSILGGLKTSNYLVMECYKLLLDFDLLKKNIGFIFMMVIFISILILLFLYIIKGRNKIEYYIQAVLKNKLVYIKNRKNLKIKNDSSMKLSNNNFSSKEQIKISKNEKNRLNTINKNNVDQNKKQKKKKKNNPPIKKSNNKNCNKNNIKKKNEQNNKYDNKSKRSSSSIKNLINNKDSTNKIENLSINIIPINNINY